MAVLSRENSGLRLELRRRGHIRLLHDGKKIPGITDIKITGGELGGIGGMAHFTIPLRFITAGVSEDD